MKSVYILKQTLHEISLHFKADFTRKRNFLSGVLISSNTIVDEAARVRLEEFEIKYGTSRDDQ